MSRGREPRAIVVLGAAGGCGASLLAGALALAWQRERAGAWLVELDIGRGDLADAWDLRGDRTLADLEGVASELAPHHLRAASRSHTSGLTALVAPSLPRPPWPAIAAAGLVAAVRDLAGAGRCVVDGGCGPGPAALAATGRADGILVACPPRLAAARRAQRLLGALAGSGDDRRCALVLTHGPERGEIGARALGRVVGAPVVGELPWAAREAARLSAGNWPRGRRARLASAVVSIARVVG